MTFAATSGRYFRIVMIGGSTTGYQIAELEIDAAPRAMPEHSSDPLGLTQSALPGGVEFSQSRPNPFGASTRVTFRLPREENVSLKVFGVNGAEVATLVDGRRSAGTHSFVFDAKNAPSGVYFFVLRAGGERLVHRAVLLK